MQPKREELIERVNQLIQKGQDVLSSERHSPPNVIAPSTVDRGLFYEWKTNSENFILLIGNKDTPYYKNFIEGVERNYTSDAKQGIGILKALREDLTLGYLTKIRDLVSSEIFVDFIEMANHLLENNYKDPAASLIGAVLERSLRDIASKNNINIKSNDDISSLNTKIADKEIYTRITQKQVQTWKGIRDSADHGKFDDYKIEDVKEMSKGVERFLAEYAY